MVTTPGRHAVDKHFVSAPCPTTGESNMYRQPAVRRCCIAGAWWRGSCSPRSPRCSTPSSSSSANGPSSSSTGPIPTPFPCLLNHRSWGTALLGPLVLWSLGFPLCVCLSPACVQSRGRETAFSETQVGSTKGAHFSRGLAWLVAQPCLFPS